MDSSSDSDNNYENLADILNNIPLRIQLTTKINPLDHLSDKETFNRFRFCKQSIFSLLEMLTDSELLPKSVFLRTTDIPPITQLLVALRFYATGNFQLSNGDLHNVCQPSVSKIVTKVSLAIASLNSKFIKYPSFPEAEIERNEFLTVGNFPGVVGVIDCTHIKIKSPGGENAELYRNRKGHFTINTQAVCNSKLKFINCVVRWSGSVHDSRIFDSSLLRAQLGDREVPGILIGDAGYQALPYLLTPIERPNCRPEIRYNNALVKVRNYIERAFGVLKKRFHCLGSELRTKLNTSLTVIVACFVLHNYAIDCGMELPDEDYAQLDDQPTTEIHFTTSSSAAGLATRRTFIATHFTE